MRERIYKILVKRYENDMEDELLKVDMLLAGSGNPIMVDHIDITGEIDKLLGKAKESEEKMAILRRFYGTN